MDFRLLVVDNGSEIDHYNSLKYNIPNDHRIKLERIENNCGYVGGINYGLKYGEDFHPDYFVIMNNDTIIDSNAFDELMHECKRHENKAIITGKVFHFDEPNRLQDIGRSFRNQQMLKFKRIGFDEIDQGQYDVVAERDMLDDVFWLFSYDLYERIGGYNSHFWFNGEQADFALRAKEEGYKLIYTPKAKLWHKGSVSIGGRELNPKLAYWNVQSSLMLRYLHLNKFYFLSFFFSVIISVLSTTVKSFGLLFTGNKKLLIYAMAKRKGLYYFIKWIFIKNVNVGKNPF